MHHDPGVTLTTGKVIDPRTGQPWNESAGFGSFDLPHVLTFNSIIGANWRTYYHGMQDDAIRNDPDGGEWMRRDAHLSSLLQERQMATASLPWHIEIGDRDNPEHKVVSANVTEVIKRTPSLADQNLWLLEGIYYGKSASQVEYEWEPMWLPKPKDPSIREQIECPVIKTHVPVHGDKIGFRMDGTPYILVNATWSSHIPNAEIITTTAGGRGLLLTGSWRKKFIIHKHRSMDVPYTNAEQGSAIHGVGIRSVLYWTAWLKKELLASILEYCERTGLGLKVWYYQMNSEASYKAVLSAAQSQADRTNILIPRSAAAGAGRAAEAVEVLDTSTAGANLLLMQMEAWEKHVERYVIGQTLSAGTEGNGLGGSGVAGMHATTKYLLTSYDADNLAETRTNDHVRYVLGWMYPQYAGLPCAFLFDKQRPNPKEDLDAIQRAWAMGVELPEDEVRSITGMPAPKDGDKVVSQVALAKAMAQANPQQGPGIPGDGDGDGVANEDGEPTDADYAQVLQMMGAA